MTNSFSKVWVRAVLTVTATVFLFGCASGTGAPKPVELGSDPAAVAVRTVWTSKIGVVDFPLQARVVGDVVTVASSDGVVAAINAATGADVWRANAGDKLAAGVGSDGHYAGVVTRSNELVVFEGGAVAWRTQLSSQVFTAPFIAGERVFVLGADRSLAALDVKTGRKLWHQQRAGDALVLRQAGVLMALGNTLLVGYSGHLAGVNPANGNVLWDAPVATPRGTNDIERLADLVSGISRDGSDLCVRAFQTAVGCVDGVRGTVRWKKSAAGAVGLAGDDLQVYGVEEDGRALAWKRADGQVSWTSDRLRYRGLSAPLVLGRSVIVGDDVGQVHLMARTDGALLKRMSTDGSAIKVTPVNANDTLVVVTHQGGVFGFRAE